MPAFVRLGRTKAALAALALVTLVVLGASPASSAPACRKGCDATKPTVTISSPGAATTVSGTVSVAGTAADNASVAKVQVAVDGGTWQVAAGTTGWSWSWPTGGLANGTHSLWARSTDAAGNISAVVTRSVTVANPVADTTPPTVTIASPAAGATVSGTVNVTGSAADNGSVTGVHVSVDGGAWELAAGTTSWSWPWSTTGSPNGAHTVAVRATDGAGNPRVSTMSVTTSNPVADATPPGVAISAPSSGSTVSGSVAVSGTASDNTAVARVEVAVDGGAWSPAAGTSTWSWSWSTFGATNGTHTLRVQAVDGAGNISSTSTIVTVANSTVAPNTQGSWVSPEGVHINVNSAGAWTISQIYGMLKASAIQLDVIGPTYTINVQDTAASQTVTSAGTTSSGGWGDFKATTYLKGVSSTFANQPNAQLTYEYGGAWTRYHLYVTQGRNWQPYLSTRWSTADGSMTIGEDSRLGSTMTWDPGEMICDDYRLLFGSAQAVAERPAYVNRDVVDPRNQPGLRDWFLSTWA